MNSGARPVGPRPLRLCSGQAAAEVSVTPLGEMDQQTRRFARGDSVVGVTRLGSSRRGWRYLALMTLLVVSAVPCAGAATWDLAQLMQALAQHPPGRATFTERKFIALLDAPVDSAGELAFVPPDRLEKRTLKPRAESLVLQGGQITIERGKQKMSLALRDHPEVAAFVESIRATLAGDRGALERTYRLKLDGSEPAWRLTLEPADAKLAAIIHRIEISGSRADVKTVEITQTDGDRSVMAIEAAPR